MTSIQTYDRDGAALPELPPLPIGVLVVRTAELLQQATAAAIFALGLSQRARAAAQQN